MGWLTALDTAEDSAALLRWRRKALTVLIWVACASRAPHLVYLIKGPFSDALRPMSVLAFASFAFAVGLGLARGSAPAKARHHGVQVPAGPCPRVGNRR